MDCRILTYNIHGLPWSKRNEKAICRWIATWRPPIVCLQEVFLPEVARFFTEEWTRIGYTVLTPRDGGVAWLGSGLLFACLKSDYDVLSDCFQPYLDYHNVEQLANKGFHAIHLTHRATQRRICLANTHTQSSTEVSFLLGSKTVDQVRKRQFAQVIEYILASRIPGLLVGDLNCEHSSHPYLRFLHPLSTLLQKHTFPRTGEDLDHVAWVPLQWSRPGCGFCDARGPTLLGCSVLCVPWSDHAPVAFTVRVPTEHFHTEG
jgi:mRNA deadenylase 3'-5' endonuclease subunit Ccr4